MKLLVVASVLDVQLPFGCTPAWWQLLKALHELGVDVIATPYFGADIESLWWRTYPNPCLRIGNAFQSLRSLQRFVLGWLPKGRGPRKPSGMQTALIRNIVAPRWHQHLRRILQREPDISAILFLNAPLNHLFEMPAQLREEFKIPVCYFDGDLPASLPSFGGFASGFSIYDGADIAQYDCLLSNSMGSTAALIERGARRAEVLWWGADPGVFRPTRQARDIDVFFYGLGIEFREDWLRDMIAIPSQKLPDLRFVVAGAKLDMDLGRAERIGLISPAQLGDYVGRSRINLNVARRAHASVYASATTRIFELAAMQQCIVSNPLLGIEEWFEPGKELVVVNDADACLAAYQRLIADEPTRAAMAQAAREKILAAHTYLHRAQKLVEILKSLTDQSGGAP